MPMGVIWRRHSRGGCSRRRIMLLGGEALGTWGVGVCAIGAGLGDEGCRVTLGMGDARQCNVRGIQ